MSSPEVSPIINVPDGINTMSLKVLLGTVIESVGAEHGTSITCGSLMDDSGDSSFSEPHAVITSPKTISLVRSETPNVKSFNNYIGWTIRSYRLGIVVDSVGFGLGASVLDPGDVT